MTQGIGDMFNRDKINFILTVRTLDVINPCCQDNSALTTKLCKTPFDIFSCRFYPIQLIQQTADILRQYLHEQLSNLTPCILTLQIHQIIFCYGHQIYVKTVKKIFGKFMLLYHIKLKHYHSVVAHHLSTITYSAMP